VLLEGTTGIGKSEIVASTARALGVGLVVLDLSLLEPPDLVGLPRIEGDTTRYARPAILPTSGDGILLLEELNRAERAIQQPALQLLTARTLHAYTLPEGWSCVAAVNPDDGEYHVSPLDRALRARFLELRVVADRATWLAWAESSGLHPAIVALVRAHEHAFEAIPPRTWTYAARLLASLEPRELRDDDLLRDLFGGYLPGAWLERFLATRDRWQAIALPIDPRALLREADRDAALLEELRAIARSGRTDVLTEIAARVEAIVRGPEVQLLASKGELRLAALEALVAELPGDARERILGGLSANALAVPLAELEPSALLHAAFPSQGALKRLEGWGRDSRLRHRAELAALGVRLFLDKHPDLPALRRSNTLRANLGHLLVRLPEHAALPLVDALLTAGIAPIRPA
jgi:MoxR-like ATPase